MRETFSLAAAILALLAAFVPVVGAILGGEPTKYVGSVGLTGLLGAVFATIAAHSVARQGHAAFAPVATATLIGIWHLLVPTAYDPGGLAVATAYGGGAVLTVFAAYLVFEEIERVAFS